MWGNPHFFVIGCPVEEELKKHIADLIEQSGLHLVDIIARKKGGMTLLEVLADSGDVSMRAITEIPVFQKRRSMFR